MTDEQQERAGATPATGTEAAGRATERAADGLTATPDDPAAKTVEAAATTVEAAGAATTDAARGATELTTATAESSETIEPTLPPPTTTTTPPIQAIATTAASATLAERDPAAPPPPLDAVRMRDALEAIKTAVVWLVVLQILTILSPLLRASLKWTLIVGLLLTTSTLAVAAVAYLKARRAQRGLPE